MSARRQRTEDKSAQPAVTEDKVAAKPDPFAGSYEDIGNGQIRFTREVAVDVPAPGGARSSVLVAPVGMVRSLPWIDERRAYYGLR